MSLKEAIAIAKKAESGLDPIHGYESNNYFVFVMADSNGQIIGNSSAFVVTKSTGESKWVPQSVFPLEDDGDYFEEFDI